VETLESSVERLPALTCPKCKRVLAASRSTREIASATGFDECLRKCTACGIGLSNARTPGAETTIYRDPLDNVPDELRDGFVEALRASLNELDRDNKVRKAAFSTSEDALTWSYFEHLRRTRRLARLGLLPTSREPLLILWGSQVGQPSSLRSAIPPALGEISRDLAEEASRRTQPDVVLDYGRDGIAIIEVKHRSGNEEKDGSHAGWDRYVGTAADDAFHDPVSTRELGLYELTRNWRLGCELRQRFERPVVVANLGPASLFQGRAGRLLEAFEAGLRQDAMQRFRRLPWPDLLELAPPQGPLAGYFANKYPACFAAG
jgi:hypothetical protein